MNTDNKLQDVALFLVLATLVSVSAFMVYIAFKKPEWSCISGYKFTNTSHPVQILDVQGHGIVCKK